MSFKIGPALNLHFLRLVYNPSYDLKGGTAQMPLYTIGYEGLDQESFLLWLKQYHIDVIADVRKLPLSRKKGFSKSALKETLHSNGIEYFNFNDLGACKSLRNNLIATGDYRAFFREYKKTISDSGPQLDEIRHMIDDGKTVALLCFEQDPHKCHRSVVADKIRERDGNGMQITHINRFL